MGRGVRVGAEHYRLLSAVSRLRHSLNRRGPLQLLRIRLHVLPNRPVPETGREGARDANDVLPRLSLSLERGLSPLRPASPALPGLDLLQEPRGDGVLEPERGRLAHPPLLVDSGVAHVLFERGLRDLVLQRVQRHQNKTGRNSLRLRVREQIKSKKKISQEIEYLNN